MFLCLCHLQVHAEHKPVKPRGISLRIPWQLLHHTTILPGEVDLAVAHTAALPETAHLSAIPAHRLARGPEGAGGLSCPGAPASQPAVSASRTWFPIMCTQMCGSPWPVVGDREWPHPGTRASELLSCESLLLHKTNTSFQRVVHASLYSLSPRLLWIVFRKRGGTLRNEQDGQGHSAYPGRGPWSSANLGSWNCAVDVQCVLRTGPGGERLVQGTDCGSAGVLSAVPFPSILSYTTRETILPVPALSW